MKPEETIENRSRHSALEDAQALLFGTAMCSLGLVMLQDLEFVTGQTAGLALIISYWSDWNFGTVFFVVNLPFYWLAAQRFGLQFVGKTFAAVTLMTLFTTCLPSLISFSYINPLTGAILFGILTGTGLLALFRHNASLGGVGILALYLQDKAGFQAGWTQLVFDIFVFCLAFFAIEPRAVAYSIVGAVFVNLTIAVNHRRDRYIGY
jgi:uncharacterized membrane-anchored protein YitT (DUF2179 family)